jgi:hypothetical protein
MQSRFHRSLFTVALAVILGVLASNSLAHGYDYAAEAPPMFGSVIGYGGAYVEVVEVSGFQGAIPLAGGANVSRISKHNLALTTDRFFFHYDHFEDALDFITTPGFGPPTITSESLDHYTFGFEKQCFDDFCSIEVRVPLAGRTTHSDSGIALGGGNMGNIGVILKHVVHRTETCSAVIGVGVDAPTGSDVEINGPWTRVEIENDAFHISPYIGALWAPNSWLYFHAFAQMDINTNGNHVALIDTFGPTVIGEGDINSPNFMMVDIAAGVWLIKNRQARHITGLAVTTEFHYTDALQDTDQLVINGGGVYSMFAGALQQNLDFSDITLGMHAECAYATQLRAALVLPLQDSQRRMYDLGLQLAVIQPF